MSDLLGASFGAPQPTTTTARAFIDAHDRLVTGLGSALSGAPAQQQMSDAYRDYLEALQDALRESGLSLDDALHEYLRAVQDAWLDVDIDDLDVEALASVAQGTTAAVWLMSAWRQSGTGGATRHPSTNGDASWDADSGIDWHTPEQAQHESGIVWHDLGTNGWESVSANGDAVNAGYEYDELDDDDDVIDLVAIATEHDEDDEFDDEYDDEDEQDDDGYEEDGAGSEWHLRGAADASGIVWQELLPRELRPPSASFEPMAREEDDMADQTPRRRTRPASRRATASVADEAAAPPAALSAGLDDALRGYLQDVRDAFAPADIRNRAEEAYKEYQRVVTEITQAADLQQQVTDLYTSYSRALQGLGSYDDVVRSYLRVMQAGFDSGELVQKLADTYQELVSAVVDAGRPERRQKALNKAYDRYTRAVQDSWSKADTSTLSQDDLLAAARNIATATTVQALGATTIAQPAAGGQAAEPPPTAPTTPRRPAAKRATRTRKKAAKTATPARKAAPARKTAKRASSTRRRPNSSGR